MLEARTVALVGASPTPGTLGQRMIAEVARSPARPQVYLVNPRHREIGGLPCHSSLDDLPEPVDLVLAGVPDRALATVVEQAASRGDRSAVIFGGAYDLPGEPPGLRARLAAAARRGGMALCGAGCMGFVNVGYGLRAVGYCEPDPLPGGPVALVTQSGSVFSALLRTRRALGFTVAVSSGQELVTPAAAYAAYALELPQTRVLALVLEAMHDPGLLRQVLAAASVRDVPVVLLTAGHSARGQEMVTAHSGALAGSDGAWEALATAYGVHRVGDLAELADTLELFAARRRAARPPAGARGRWGIATVHDSGLERAHTADLAEALGVPFARIGAVTRKRLARVLDPGLEPDNPLDAWGASERAEYQLTESLAALAADPAVAAVALAVDLVPEFDGDSSYPRAVTGASARTGKPLVVLAGLPAAIDPGVAAELRGGGIPVLEGTRSGLAALRHLLGHAARPPLPRPAPPPVAASRRRRWRAAIEQGEVAGARLFRLLGEYGIPATQVREASTLAGALAAAAAIGYPVVLKTAHPEIGHKSEAGGVVLGIAGPAELRAAYAGLAARLGPRVLVCETAAPGVELAVGITADPALGPLVVVGAGGVLVEHLADRAVALPPLSTAQARRMLVRLRVSRLLAGVRGQPPADLGAVAAVIAAVSVIACELGDGLAGLDINPLVCGPGGAVAADALLVPRGGCGAAPPGAAAGETAAPGPAGPLPGGRGQGRGQPRGVGGAEPGGRVPAGCRRVAGDPAERVVPGGDVVERLGVQGGVLVDLVQARRQEAERAVRGVHDRVSSRPQRGGLAGPGDLHPAGGHRRVEALIHQHRADHGGVGGHVRQAAHPRRVRDLRPGLVGGLGEDRAVTAPARAEAVVPDRLGLVGGDCRSGVGDLGAAHRHHVRAGRGVVHGREREQPALLVSVRNPAVTAGEERGDPVRGGAGVEPVQHLDRGRGVERLLGGGPGVRPDRAKVVGERERLGVLHVRDPLHPLRLRDGRDHQVDPRPRCHRVCPVHVQGGLVGPADLGRDVPVVEVHRARDVGVVVGDPAFRHVDMEGGRRGQVERLVEDREVVADGGAAERVEDRDRLSPAGVALRVQRAEVVLVLDVGRPVAGDLEVLEAERPGWRLGRAVAGYRADDDLRYQPRQRRVRAAPGCLGSHRHEGQRPGCQRGESRLGKATVSGHVGSLRAGKCTRLHPY
jgi:acyl-CoA synthetase (NDP forming)